MEEESRLMIQVNQFGFEKGKTLLENIECTVQEGTIIGLVAPNGHGKTTFIDIIAGRYFHLNGEILFNNISPNKQQIPYKREVTKMLNPLDLISNISGRDHLQLYAIVWKKSKNQIENVIKQFKMSHFIDKKVETYSLGMRQRLCFALVVLVDTSVLLLDEVMNGLDLTNVSIVTKMLQDLKKGGKIIILASHLLENLDEISDEIWFVYQKSIYSIHNLKDDQWRVEVTLKSGRQLENIGSFLVLRNDFDKLTFRVDDAENLRELMEQLLYQKDVIQNLYMGEENLRYLYKRLYQKSE